MANATIIYGAFSLEYDEITRKWLLILDGDTIKSDCSSVASAKKAADEIAAADAVEDIPGLPEEVWYEGGYLRTDTTFRRVVPVFLSKSKKYCWIRGEETGEHRLIKVSVNLLYVSNSGNTGKIVTLEALKVAIKTGPATVRVLRAGLTKQSFSA